MICILKHTHLGRSKGYGPFPFFNTVQILPSNSTNLEENALKNQFKKQKNPLKRYLKNTVRTCF